MPFTDCLAYADKLRELNRLLKWIDFKAYVEGCYFVLRDLQGYPLGGVENEKFHCISDILSRLEHYFDDTFLNGEICCNCEHDFQTYEEAMAACVKRGYHAEASAIALYLKLRA